MPMNQLATSEESLTDWLNQRNAWRRKVDITENVVLAYGYEGCYWSQEKDWEFIRYDFEAEEQEDVATMEEESNAIRQSLQRLLPSYFQAMISAKNWFGSKRTVFYHFLLQKWCGNTIKKMWRLQAIESRSTRNSS